jgi:hypothetical protein
MMDFNAWVSAGAGLLGAGLATVNVVGLLRMCLQQRARLQLERERSARSAARANGFAQMVNRSHASVRFVERDDDGERLIEIGRSVDSSEVAA